MPNTLDYILALGQGGVRGLREKQALAREIAKERQAQLEREREFQAQEKYRGSTLGLQERQLGEQERTNRELERFRGKEFEEGGRRFDVTSGLQERGLDLEGGRLDLAGDELRQMMELRRKQLEQEGALGRMGGAIRIGEMRGGQSQDPVDRLIQDIIGPVGDIEALGREGGYTEAVLERARAIQALEEMINRPRMFRDAAGTASSQAPITGLDRIRNPKPRSKGYPEDKPGDPLGVRR